MTGLPLALCPLEYWQLAHHGKKNENPFCAMLAENPATLLVCLEEHDSLIRHIGHVPNTVTCQHAPLPCRTPVDALEQAAPGCAWSYGGLGPNRLGLSLNVISWFAVPVTAGWCLLSLWLARKQQALALAQHREIPEVAVTA